MESDSSPPESPAANSRKPGLRASQRDLPQGSSLGTPPPRVSAQTDASQSNVPKPPFEAAPEQAHPVFQKALEILRREMPPPGAAVPDPSHAPAQDFQCLLKN